MRTLAQALQDRDLGFLRLIQEHWNLDLHLRDRKSGAEQLARAMLKSDPKQYLLDELPPASRGVLNALIRNGGSIPYAAVARQFGEIRDMGPGKRDREKPWLQPASPVEDLWYRGLLFRAFIDTQTGPQEFAYIPEDLIALLPKLPGEEKDPYGHESSDPEVIMAAHQAVIDDATTFIAALRRAGSTLDPQSMRRFMVQPEALGLITHLLQEIGVIAGSPYEPASEALPAFLQYESSSRSTLIEAWKVSVDWNDLSEIPHLKPAGDTWPNDPLISRNQLLAMLEPIPRGTWWSLDAFIQDERAKQPDFQRPAGDFDSWIFQDPQTNAAIHGFESWDRIEGALLIYVLCGPLHWLGAVDLGLSEEGSDPTAFRIDPALDGIDSAPPARKGKIRLTATGEIRASRASTPKLRYQIARFCDWADFKSDTYHYQLSPAALQAAVDQGLNVEQILRIFRESAGRSPPDHLVKAIRRWIAQGSEIRVELNLVLRVKRRAMLEELKANPKTARFIQDVLGPTSFSIRAVDLDRFRKSALRASILIELGGREKDLPF
jgi:hypothetical protein